MTETSKSGDFRHHLRASAVLGIPLVGAHVTHMLINVIDTIMLGWLGISELAAGTLAFQSLFIVYIFGIGFAAALMPLVSGAIGRDDPRAARRSARMGLWVLLLVVMLFMVPLTYTEDILLLLGQKPDLAELAQRYMVIAQWSLVPAFIYAGLRNFLTSLERAKAIFWITIAMAIVNAILNYALIFGNFGFPRLEMEGAAIATVAANMLALFAGAFYVARSRFTRDYDLFARLWRPDWPAFREIVRLGIPISLTILAEAGLFSAASVMIGWLGTVPLAAHGIALQVASLAFMVPLGLSQVITVRVGNAAGRKDWLAVGEATKAVIALALAFTVLSGLTFVLFPKQLVGIFLDWANPDALTVLAYAVPLIWMAAAFQIVDGLQAIGVGALRGLSDTKVPLIIASISYWFVGLAAAWLLAFPLGFGGTGIWAGLAIGLACAAFFLLRRFIYRQKLGLTSA